MLSRRRKLYVVAVIGLPWPEREGHWYWGARMRKIWLTVPVVVLFWSADGYCQAGSEARGGPPTLGTAPLVVGEPRTTVALAGPGDSPFYAAQLPTTPEARVRVQSIRITGTTVFPPEEIRLLIASAEGQELSLAEIEALAARITSYYRSRGYVIARAYVPPQRVQDGILEITAHPHAQVPQARPADLVPLELLEYLPGPPEDKSRLALFIRQRRHGHPLAHDRLGSYARITHGRGADQFVQRNLVCAGDRQEQLQAGSPPAGLQP